jgi:hypothetical protein
MTNGPGESENVEVDELVVLKKFEGDPEPENEFERLTVHNGKVVSHDKVRHGKVVGPVKNSELLGKDIGPLTQAKEVD